MQHSPDEAYGSEDEYACSEDEVGSTDVECSLAESGYEGTHSPTLSHESRSVVDHEWLVRPLVCMCCPQELQS